MWVSPSLEPAQVTQVVKHYLGTPGHPPTQNPTVPAIYEIKNVIKKRSPSIRFGQAHDWKCTFNYTSEYWSLVRGATHIYDVCIHSHYLLFLTCAYGGAQNHEVRKISPSPHKRLVIK